MRTTLDLPDPLFRDLKAHAAQKGVSLKQVLRAAVERELQTKTPARKRRLKFPILDSKRPGSLRITNAEIEDLLA